MKAGRNSRHRMIIECVGPLCFSPGINKSMSGIIESANSIGTFTFTCANFDVAFPERYPIAKCPTAYIVIPFMCLCTSI